MIFDSNKFSDDYLRLEDASILVSQITGKSTSPERLLQAYGGRQLTVFWNFSRPNVKAEYTPEGQGASEAVFLQSGLYALTLLTEDYTEYGDLAGAPAVGPDYSFADEYYLPDDFPLAELLDIDELGTQFVLRLPEHADNIFAESWSLNPAGFRVIDGYSPTWPLQEELLLSRVEMARLTDALAAKVAAASGTTLSRSMDTPADCGDLSVTTARLIFLCSDDGRFERMERVGRMPHQKNMQFHGKKMDIEIRPDLHSVSHYLCRLVQYRQTFHQYNVEDWSHLKYKEDFSQVYALSKDFVRAFESIYESGRDLAVFMSRKLGEFNDAGEYPTLKSYVDSFSGGWVCQIPQLRSVLEDAKSKAVGLRHQTPWSVGRMIQLFETQVEMIVQVEKTLEHLRQSELYREESGFRKNALNLYGSILACIHDTGKMFERNPSTHAGSGEEMLRDHILVTLGGALNGSVTGESFNGKGKTDILVRIAGNNELIGECKFWVGKSVYLSTIDQLFGYLGWRDNKAAVIIFVKNKNFDSVIDKIKTYTPQHPNFSAFIDGDGDAWLNYEFKTPDNPSRVVQLAVMAYHIPK